MLFKRAFYPGLVDGSITLTFRLWKRPQVKLGGRYRLGTDGALEVAAASRHGPWTRAALSIIERRPRVAASRLAAQLGRETPAFKGDVRKLKNLGLTLSFDVGYEISPRGRAFLRGRDSA